MSSVDRAELFDALDRYFERTLDQHGGTARGVDWKSTEAQEIRFVQLTKLLDRRGPFSILDYGCGYGALAHYLHAGQYDFTYLGFDVSERMVALGREKNPDPARCSFSSERSDLESADYTVASGLFNLRLEVPVQEWKGYVRELLEEMAALSRIGFGFNMLTSYSDPERRRTDLFYADPAEYFDFCKRHLAPHVALLHDYGEFEFTIVARRHDANR